MTAAARRMLTTAEAARVLRLSPRQVADLASSGRLASFRTPGRSHFRFDWDVVQAEAGRRRPTQLPPPPPPPADTTPTRVVRPPCRLCRHNAEHRPADSCVHCSLWVCDVHLVEHLQGIWPPAEAS